MNKYCDYKKTMGVPGYMGYAHPIIKVSLLSTIEGPPNGKAGTEYEYTFTTIDSEGDDIYYYIEWGDFFFFIHWFRPPPLALQVFLVLFCCTYSLYGRP